MWEEIAASVLASVITGTGRWIGGAALSARGKVARRDADIAAWFDTYEVTRDAPPLPDVPEAAAAEWLRRNDVHGVLHELLAVRLTDGPETAVDGLRAALRRTAYAALDTHWRWTTWTEGDRAKAMHREERYGPRAIDAAADLVFDWADGAFVDLVARLEARDPQRYRTARTDGFGARVTAVLGAVERHLTALHATPDPAEDAAWAARYRAQAVRAYGSIEPPDFARRRKVPVEDLYVPPDITEPGAARASDGPPRTLTLDALTARLDRTVLLGDPGGGKSTAVQVIAYRCAADPAARVPFVVVLREFARGGGGPERSVTGHIEERLSTRHQCAAPEGAVERLLLSGQAAVLFDGLDELTDTGRRLEVTRVVEQFCARYPLTPVLVTSRVVGYDEARLDDAQFTPYVIAGFDEERTRAYVRNWFAHGDDAMGEPEEVADAFMAESAAITDLRSNPLMLSYLCILYRGAGTLPRDRPGVYAKCAEMLLDLWDARRGVTIDLRARNHLEPALREIAYWLFTRDGPPEVTERELVVFTAGYLHRNVYEHRADAEAAARGFVAFCRGRAWILSDAGTTARGEPLYRFTHRTFLEYFAAYALASSADTSERLARTLAPRVAREEWEVVAQLAVQITDHERAHGAERFFSALLGEKRRRSEEGRGNVLAFLARCLAFVEPPPGVVRDLVERVVGWFTDGDPDDVRRYGPLMDLMGYGYAWRDLIAERIEAAADRGIAAGGPARLRTLLWVAVIDEPVLYGRGRFASDHADVAAYLSRFGERLLARHADAVTEMAATDDRIWTAAVFRPLPVPLLSMRAALETRDRAPGPMLLDTSAGAFSQRWISHGEFLLGNVAREEADYHALAVRSCAELARWAADGRPPFFRVAEEPMRVSGKRLALPGLPPDPDTYAGCVLLLLAFAEAGGSAEFDVMGDLGPYLRHETGDLPDLPVPEHFQELFRRWARGEVRFVEIG